MRSRVGRPSPPAHGAHALKMETQKELNEKVELVLSDLRKAERVDDFEACEVTLASEV